MRLFAFALAMSVALPVAAEPWVYQEHGSVFEDGKTHIALTAAGSYAVGLRCSGPDDITLIFITPEEADPDNVDLLNQVSPKILVRVDQNDPIEIAAQLDVVESGLTMYGAAPPALGDQLVAAGSGVSVAVRLLGELFHETRFGVQGSTATVSKIMDLCGLTADQ
jgi:hypothetical protein